MNLRAVPSGEGSRGGFDPRTVHDAGRRDPRRKIALSPGGTNLAGRQNLSESTLAFGVGIDYDTGMRTTEQWAAEDTCPWCGEADPGEQSGITTCCAEAVIGPAEAQLAKGAK